MAFRRKGRYRRGGFKRRGRKSSFRRGRSKGAKRLRIGYRM